MDVAEALAQAFSHLDAGRPAEARRLARALDGRRPEPPGLAYLQGLLALADGQGRKAAQHLARALARTPDAVPPLLAMARAQQMQGRLAEALAAYRRLIVTAPDVVEALSELAELLLAARRYPDARVLLLWARRLRPDRGRICNNLGVAERAVGHLAAAVACFAAAVADDPAAAKAYANLAGGWRPLGRIADACSAACRAVILAADDAAHWLESGQARAAAGDHEGAVADFTEAARRTPGRPEPLWLAAGSLAALGRRDAAAEHYRRVLAADPADTFGAAAALAQLGAGEAPERTADAHLRTLYDQYAATFDDDLVDRLEYRGPEILAAAIGRTLGPGPFHILDAGCGTGLSGMALKPLARRLDGVDLSPRMAEQAGRRGVYDNVEVGDLIGTLRAHPLSYDLVAAADVLIYQGDLTPVMLAASAALRPGGGFAFTVERGEEAFQLRASGRYAHSAAHLRAAAAAAGLLVRLVEETSTRREGGHPVPGLVCVLTKP